MIITEYSAQYRTNEKNTVAMRAELKILNY